MNHDRAPKRTLEVNFETELPCKLAKCKTSQDTDEIAKENCSIRKPNLSYIAMISMAIQSVPSKQMLLSEIYEWISKNYPYYKMEDKSWRNSIRHNLSLNECFIKSGRSESGKGSYWSIHPANIEDFGNGDFRRRQARRRVRKCDDELRMLCKPCYASGDSVLTSQPSHSQVKLYSGYVPMSRTYVSTGYLTSIFGTAPIRTKDEQNRNAQQTDRFVLPNEVIPPTLQTFPGSLTGSPGGGENDTPSVSVNVNVNLDGFQQQFRKVQL
ncbi:forkhead box C1-A-like [Pecten maximus]|uniref:forkhead box C1-A-like n=1 Tax=Pecten maximus TaxID=6579 RepID=UPI00145802A1|nr:forkhead box C1-A-like [Pecten maximus]